MKKEQLKSHQSLGRIIVGLVTLILLILVAASRGWYTIDTLTTFRRIFVAGVIIILLIEVMIARAKRQTIKNGGQE
jgi:cell division protein FtsW (lipid II flippase)